MVIEFFLIVTVYVSRQMKSVTCGNQNEDTGRQVVLERLAKNVLKFSICYSFASLGHCGKTILQARWAVKRPVNQYDM